MADATITLHQFPMSHFNEKARWALDWKGLAHERKNYMPGPHEKPIRALSGQSSTPVLQIGDDVVAGSAAIVATLEDRYPERPLLPEDPELRREALDVQERFDAEVGPAARAALFSVMLNHPGYVAKTFGRPQPLLMRTVYRMVLPFVRGKVVRAYRTDDAAYVAACREETERALDFVAQRAEAGEGHIVGRQFTVADLTCAALLAVVAAPDHPDMTRPKPVPQPVADFLGGFSEHPGTEWVRDCYSRYRPATSAR